MQHIWLSHCLLPSMIGLIWMISNGRPVQAQDLSVNHGTIFYPFGEGVGDQVVREVDEWSSGEIPITVPFPFYDSLHSSIKVSDNGGLFFTRYSLPYYEIEPFPLDEDRQIIAPFYADVDLTYSDGEIYYREDQDPALLARATDDVRSAFGQTDFTATWVFVCTWAEVTYYQRMYYYGDYYCYYYGYCGYYGYYGYYVYPGYYGQYGYYPYEYEYYGYRTEQTNTFQAVLISDGFESFAMFNYGLISWTTGDDNDGYMGFGGTPAEAGINAGDGVRYDIVPASGTPFIIDVASTSNVGVTGRWMFQTGEVACGDVSGRCEDPWTCPCHYGRWKPSYVGCDAVTECCIPRDKTDPNNWLPCEVHCGDVNGRCEDPSTCDCRYGRWISRYPGCSGGTTCCVPRLRTDPNNWTPCGA